MAQLLNTQVIVRLGHARTGGREPLLGTYVAVLSCMTRISVNLAACILLLGLSAAGCASLGNGRPAVVELSSKAPEPVGGVIPVFIKVHCTEHCGTRSVGLSRREVFARDQSGKWIEALPPREAAELAGGAQPLLVALGSSWGNAGYLTRQAFAGIYGHDYWGIIFAPFILGYTAYMAAHPELTQMERLDEISIP